MTAQKIRDKKLEVGGVRLGFGNRFKAQVLQDGKVIRETAWKNNLILDQGMNKVATTSICDLFTSCCVGTANTPTTDDAGVITAARAGTAVTASAPIFAGGDVGKLLVWDSGAKSMITVFTDSTHVTVANSGTVAAGTFKMYRVSQTALGAELKRSVTYVTGASNCFSQRVGSVFTNQRTWDFTIEVGNVNYAEVGFSDNPSAGANLNMRGLFSGGAVTVLIGQQIRVIYQFILTLSPTSPRVKTPTITGWPALQQAVVADPALDTFTLASHGLSVDMAVSFQGTAAPTPLVLGTTYYVSAPTTNTFKVAATPGGAAIDLTDAGTAVVLVTNVKGQESSETIGLSSVLNSGPTSSWEGRFENEPTSGVALFTYYATDATALQSFPGAAFNPTGQVTFNLTSDAYSNGSFTRTKTATLGAGGGTSNAIRSIGLGTVSAGTGAAGVRFLFDTKQAKDNLHTLTLTWRWTWDRDFS